MLLGLVLSIAPLVLASNPASADSDPIGERAAITYRLDRAHHRVNVTGSVRFTNRVPVRRVGGSLQRTYVDRWGPIAIPADATRVRVRPRSVKAQRLATGTAFDNLVFSFPRVFNGGSVSFTVSWAIPGGADSPTGTVVSDPYSRLCWTGQPVDSGPIVLVVPPGLEVVTQGSPVRTTRTGGQRRISARSKDLATFYACTDIYDPALLIRRDLVSPLGHAVRVEGLPGHELWLDTTSQEVVAALAGVEAVVGAPLPGDHPIKVREVPANALQGYGGEFDPGSGVIRVGDQGASVALLSHELAHAWFNADTLADNWLWEGFAEWASRETVGMPCSQAVDPPFGGRGRLSDWKVLQGSNPSFEDQQSIQWQYAAACAIEGQVTDLVGEERMQQVVTILLSGGSPYDVLPRQDSPATSHPSPAPISLSAGPSPSEPPRLPPGGRMESPTASDVPSAGAVPSSTGTTLTVSPTRSSQRRSRPVDWRQWLDIVDQVGLVQAGVEDLTFAERLLVSAGVIRQRDVRGRAETRDAFRALQGMAPRGVTPALVRHELDAWDFDAARRDIRLATRVAARIATLAPGSAELTARWADYERVRSRTALLRLRDELS